MSSSGDAFGAWFFKYVSCSSFSAITDYKQLEKEQFILFTDLKPTF